MVISSLTHFLKTSSEEEFLVSLEILKQNVRCVVEHSETLPSGLIQSTQW